MVFCCILHCFVAKFVCFFAIFAVLSHDRFLRFTRYYVEKNLAKNSARGEKMTNMRHCRLFHATYHLQAAHSRMPHFTCSCSTPHITHITHITYHTYHISAPARHTTFPPSNPGHFVLRSAPLTLNRIRSECHNLDSIAVSVFASALASEAETKAMSITIWFDGKIQFLSSLTQFNSDTFVLNQKHLISILSLKCHLQK